MNRYSVNLFHPSDPVRSKHVMIVLNGGFQWYKESDGGAAWSQPTMFESFSQAFGWARRARLLAPEWLSEIREHTTYDFDGQS